MNCSIEDAVGKAKLAYAIGIRMRESIARHCQDIACCEACKAQLAQIVPIDHAGLLEAILSTVDERYHDAVIRELEAIA